MATISNGKKRKVQKSNPMNNRRRLKEIGKYSLKDLPGLWQELSEDLPPDDALYPYRHNAAAASRAKKWLSAAVLHPSDADGIEPGAVPLSKVVGPPVEDLAAQARAWYLHIQIGLSLKEAISVRGCDGISNDQRRAANEVATAVRRALRFLNGAVMVHYGYDDSATDGWPAPVKGKKHSHGMILYRAIVRVARAEGISSPSGATPDSIRRGCQRLWDMHLERSAAGDWNTKRRQLLAAIKDSLLPGIDHDAWEAALPVMSSRLARPDRRNLRADEVADLWPEYFRCVTGSRTRLDKDYGLLGFFNRLHPGNRPLNPGGNSCPRDNLNGRKGLTTRDFVIRRYLRYWSDALGGLESVELADLFTRARIEAWLHWIDATNSTLTSNHWHEFVHLRYTVALYFEHNIPSIEELLEIVDIPLPRPNKSVKGEVIIDKAGVADLLDWVEAFQLYAQKAPTVDLETRKRGSGFYLPRMSWCVDLCLRILTGLRPEVVDQIEYFEQEPKLILGPSLFPAGERTYRVAVPQDYMKQHARTRRAKNKAKAAGKTYTFAITYPRFVEILEQYLENGWRKADAVLRRKTNRLLLRRDGSPYGQEGLGNAYCTGKRAVLANFRKKTGKLLPDLDRYAHRHIIGEALHRHEPGSRLKSWYLTHRIDRGSDANYGKSEAQYLVESLHEILNGQPPKHEQERIRQAEATRAEQERLRWSQAMLEQQQKLQSELERMNDALVQREKTIDQLRADLHQHRNTT